MTETNILEDAKNIFVQIKERVEKFDSDLEQTEFYRKAQEMERQSQQFYEEKSKQVNKNSQRQFFRELAKEEEKHYYLLDNIIEFVSRPETWLENAEWYHLDAY